MEYAPEVPAELQVVVVLEDLGPAVEALAEGLELAAGAVVPVAELPAEVLPRAKGCWSSGYSLAGQPVFTSKTWSMWIIYICIP